MEPAQHQMMGYDRAITMFSPDGRLLQVEYAKKTVKQGSAAIGIACNEGVVLLTDKRIMSNLIIPESVEKIYKIDSHMIATASGLLADARILVDRAQLKAQQHMVTYDSPIDTSAIVKDIADLKQMCTQSGGLRPFGVSMIIAGLDSNGPRLFVTDPTGVYFQHRAAVIGENYAEIEKVIEKGYKQSMSVNDAVKLGITALKKTVEDLNSKRIDCAYLKKGEKEPKFLEDKEIQALLKK